MSNVVLHGGLYPLVHEMGYTHANENWIHPDRILDFHVFIYCFSGQMQVIENGVEFIMHPGDTLFLHKGIRHWGSVAADPGTKTFWIHFYDSETVAPKSNGSLVWDSKPNLFSKEDYRIALLLPKHFHVPNYPYLERNIKKLVDAYQSVEPYRQIAISLLSNELFLNLYRLNQQNRTLNKSDVLVQKIIVYLENHLECKISSSDLSSFLQLNYKYLSTLFRKHTGSSISSYHERIRVMRAAELLKTTTMNISEVSRSMGYEDPLYFSRVFKKVMGTSPSVYMTQVYRMP
jgi:AraC family transcriptional regulator of arabinose operon